MAYDKERKDEIDAMGVGDLIHTMLVEFDPEHRTWHGEPGLVWQQSSAYGWAKNRLDELLPDDPPPAHS